MLAKKDERIRALEAELAAVRKSEKEWHRDEERLREKLKARAEKAETQVEQLKVELTAANDHVDELEEAVE